MTPTSGRGRKPAPILQKRCRETGNVVAVYDSAEGGVPGATARWAVFCTAHETWSYYRTKNESLAASARPTEWCAPCSKHAPPIPRTCTSPALRLREVELILKTIGLTDEQKLARIQEVVL